ncbi:MAG: glycosyltransferase family 2 protein [Candidatus Paceibacterota bacterium]|jgi:glycosyltransferase involved in cell wall biosynthesis
MKISCIIPAYNEEKGIDKILSIIVPLIGKVVYEVIVIDDGSQDRTREIIKKFTTVNLIEKNVNEGKSAAVADGINISKGDYIFLMDADLQDLNEKNIRDLINPIENGISDVAISYRKNAWPLPFSPFKEIDCLSGERILPKTPVITSLEEMKQLPSFGLEIFLNKKIILNDMRITIVQWPNVENVFPQNKRGWFRGIKQMLKMWLDMLSTASIIEIYSQNIKMKKLLVR